MEDILEILVELKESNRRNTEKINKLDEENEKYRKIINNT